MSFLLVTTAIEKTWKEGKPILFLGEWCRVYSRKFLWEKREHAVCAPLEFSVKQKIDDIKYVESLSLQILKELSSELNRIHNVRYSTRFWNIVLGHWLLRYVAVAFNRYYSIKNTLETYSIDETVFLKNKYYISTYDTWDFCEACNDDQWNLGFYQKVLEFLKFPNITVLDDNNALVHYNSNNSNVQPNFTLKKFIFTTVSTFLSFFKKNSDAFIITTYLKPIEEVKLQFLLFQMPQLWRSPPLIKHKLNLEFRNSLNSVMENHEGFDLFVRKHLSEALPICYMEGFTSLLKQVNDLSWPKNPKFIFTSNNFDTDEIFKVWTGIKVEQGIKYFTGQHGNNYGTHICDGNESWPERSSVDTFISWGWTDGGDLITPGFIFKTLNRKQFYRKNGGILLIQNLLPYQTYTYDTRKGHLEYQLNQFKFTSSLEFKIQQSLIVRLHSAYIRNNWNEIQRWNDFNPNIKLDIGRTKIDKLIRKSRIIVHSYDSTGILETLNLNIPTLCFWLGGFDHLLPSAKPFYEILKNAGIFYDSAENLADFINKNWNNIEEWWLSSKVQNARIEFCDKYAKSASSVRCLRDIFNNLQSDNGKR